MPCKIVSFKNTKPAVPQTARPHLCAAKPRQREPKCKVNGYLLHWQPLFLNLCHPRFLGGGAALERKGLRAGISGEAPHFKDARLNLSEPRVTPKGSMPGLGNEGGYLKHELIDLKHELIHVSGQ